MALYDGNQLPENPTSVFQLVVSLMYTLMMLFNMSMGGFAAWATQKRLLSKGGGSLASGQSQHPTHYMSDLVHKRNTICRGLLAFIPAVFSLAHLYTSSLHSSRMYSAGNVVFAALLGYSAFFMGKTLQQLVVESDRMDTTKAVYESLYMLANGYDRLRRHKPQTPDNAATAPVEGIFDHVEDARSPSEGKKARPAGQQPWVLFNVFLAIAAQDDAPPQLAHVFRIAPEVSNGKPHRISARLPYPARRGGELFGVALAKVHWTQNGRQVRPLAEASGVWLLVVQSKQDHTDNHRQHGRASGYCR
jgi:hypothetical protein